MIVDDLLKSPVLWLSIEQDTGIAVSSRIRLARNLRGVPFPGRASPEQCQSLWTLLARAFEQMPATRNALLLEMSALDPVVKDILKERHMISRELSEKGKGSGVIIAQDEQIAAMVNEEDHVRLQAVGPGLNLEELWKRIDAVDTALEQHVEYAFLPRYGYLTACPTNVGTGLRASVMMHLPGLRMMNEIESVVRGLERMGLAVRGLQGEGSDAVGDMFQVSNQATMGQTETEIMGQLTVLVKELVEHERNARLRLTEQRRIYLVDQVGRAYGVLLHAHVLSSRESFDMLSALRLGVEFNLVQNLTVGQINKIMLLTQPGHLQRMAGRVMDAEERDQLRARLLREQLKDLCLAEAGRKRRSSRRVERARKTP
jgi:protein arginine kinase